MNKKICIAHGGDLSEPSGGTNRVSAIVSRLIEEGYEVILVIPETDGQLPEGVTGARTETLSLATDGVKTQPKRAYEIAKLSQKIAQKENAILQYEHSTLAGVGTLFRGNIDIVDMHDFAYRSPLYGELPFGTLIQQCIRFVETRAVRNADKIIVVSEVMKEMVRSEWDISKEKISVVPNGYFESKVSDFRGLDPVEGRVTFLGTLHPKLNLDIFVSISKLTTVKELIIIGDANKREKLEIFSEEIPEIKLKQRLPDNEAFEILATSEVAINPQHPSDLQASSCPVKLAYYAALGVPTVATSGPDLAHWLADQGSLITVDPKKDFQNAVAEIISSNKLRDRMIKNCYDSAEELMWSAQLDQYIKIIEE